MTNEITHTSPAGMRSLFTGFSFGRARAGVGLVSIAALFLLPFIWPLHTRPLTSFYNEWIAAVLVIFSSFAFACRFTSGSRGDRVEVPAVAMLFIPLIAIVMLQWQSGMLTYGSDGLFPLWTFALATAAIVLGSAAVRQIGLERLLVWASIAIICGGVINFGMQILQLCAVHGIRFSGVNFFSGASYYGSLAQANHLATYFSWALIGTLYLYAVKKAGTFLVFLLILLFLVGATLTLSRTSWLQIAFISIAASLMVSRMSPSSRPHRWGWILLLPVLYAVVNLVLPVVLGWMDFSLRTTALQRVASAPLDGARALLLEQGWQIFLQNPWLGIGPNQLYFNQFLLLDRMEETLFATSTHNAILDLLVFTGLFGAIPFLAMLGMWLYRSSTVPLSVERIAVWLLLSVLAIHAMLELPHTYGYFLLPAALFIGAIETKQIAIRQAGLLRILPLAISLYGVIVSVSLIREYRQLESLYDRYYVGQRFVNSVNVAGLEEIEAFRRATWFGGAAEFLLCYNFALNENALGLKLAITGRTIRHLPEPNIVYRHVVLLALDGRQEEGIALLARLRKSFPKAHNEIADELIKLGKSQPLLFGRLGAAMSGTRL